MHYVLGVDNNAVECQLLSSFQQVLDRSSQNGDPSELYSTVVLVGLQ